MDCKDLKPFLERALRDYEKDDGLVLTGVKEQKGTDGFDGFHSEVTAVEVDGKTKSGEPYSNSLFVKRHWSDVTKMKLINLTLAFKNETVVYCEVLPLVLQVAADYLPRCFYGSDECIVLENLSTHGYKMVDKSKGLDIPHTELAVKAIASFHASTYYLKLENEDKFANITSKLTHLHRGNVMSEHVLNGLLTQGVGLLKQVNDPTLDNAITKLSSLIGKVMPTIQQLETSDMDVLGHGDFWINNLMFRYQEGTVKEIKMVDWQTSTRMSLAADLWKLLYICVKPDLLINEIDQLVSKYVSTFRETLVKLKLPESKVPTEAVLKGEINSREFYGLLTSVLYFPVMHMTMTEELMEAMKNMMSGPNVPEMTPELMSNFMPKEFPEKLAAIVKTGVRRNLF